jgi:hypothetical protein
LAEFNRRVEEEMPGFLGLYHYCTQTKDASNVFSEGVQQLLACALQSSILTTFQMRQLFMVRFSFVAFCRVLVFEGVSRFGNWCF